MKTYSSLPYFFLSLCCVLPHVAASTQKGIIIYTLNESSKTFNQTLKSQQVELTTTLSFTFSKNGKLTLTSKAKNSSRFFDKELTVFIKLQASPNNDINAIPYEIRKKLPKKSTEDINETLDIPETSDAFFKADRDTRKIKVEGVTAKLSTDQPWLKPFVDVLNRAKENPRGTQMGLSFLLGYLCYGLFRFIRKAKSPSPVAKGKSKGLLTTPSKSPLQGKKSPNPRDTASTSP